MTKFLEFYNKFDRAKIQMKFQFSKAGYAYSDANETAVQCLAVCRLYARHTHFLHAVSLDRRYHDSSCGAPEEITAARDCHLEGNDGIFDTPLHCSTGCPFVFALSLRQLADDHIILGRLFDGRLQPPSVISSSQLNQPEPPSIAVHTCLSAARLFIDRVFQIMRTGPPFNSW